MNGRLVGGLDEHLVKFEQADRKLVEQLRASWNSLLSWLREVEAWGQAAKTEGWG